MLAAIFSAMNLIVFITSLHNTIRYLIGLKITKHLIVLYYVFTLISSSYKVGLFVFVAINPPLWYDFDFVNKTESWALYAEVAYVLSLSTGFILYLTMQ